MRLESGDHHMASFWSSSSPYTQSALPNQWRSLPSVVTATRSPPAAGSSDTLHSAKTAFHAPSGLGTRVACCARPPLGAWYRLAASGAAGGSPSAAAPPASGTDFHLPAYWNHALPPGMSQRTSETRPALPPTWPRSTRSAPGSALNGAHCAEASEHAKAASAAASAAHVIRWFIMVVFRQRVESKAVIARKPR